jgi:hypothetical protein
VPDFSIQLGRVVLEIPEGNPIVAIAIAGVLKENRNTLVKRGRLTYLCF